MVVAPRHGGPHNPSDREEGVGVSVQLGKGRRPLLQAALNGARRREEHPSLPVTSPELADSAARAVEAGSDSIHFHVRDTRGLESLAAVDVGRALTAMRAAIPATPIGVSTGAWIVPHTEERYRMVSAWTVLPDFASVNFDEPGSELLANMLLSKGIGIEAGVANATAAARLARSGLAGKCLHALVEPQTQELPKALDALREIQSILDGAGIALPWLLHGVDRTAWPLIAEAAARGHGTRVGFEDTLTLPDGSMAESNAVLVQEARRVLEAT
jgi:uncharacterized protein (DUF849 family)